MLHILHSVDVHAGHSSFSRALRVSAKKYGGSEANGRTESGHRFCTFYTGRGYVDAIAASLGSSGMRTEAGHLLTSSFICDSPRFFANIRIFSAFLFFSRLCSFNAYNNRNIILLKEKLFVKIYNERNEDLLVTLIRREPIVFLRLHFYSYAKIIYFKATRVIYYNYILY